MHSTNKGAQVEYFISPSERYYVRTIGDNPRKEVADFPKQFPTLAQDFHFPSFFTGAHDLSQGYFSSILRMSSKDIQLWTHYDITDNLLCHITGKKRVVLFPPSDVNKLYVEGSSSPVLDVDHPDLSRFPRFAKTHAMECILQPGDILFIPALCELSRFSSLSLSFLFPMFILIYFSFAYFYF